MLYLSRLSILLEISILKIPKSHHHHNYTLRHLSISFTGFKLRKLLKSSSITASIIVSWVCLVVSFPSPSPNVSFSPPRVKRSNHFIFRLFTKHLIGASLTILSKTLCHNFFARSPSLGRRCDHIVFYIITTLSFFRLCVQGRQLKRDYWPLNSYVWFYFCLYGFFLK